MGKRGAPAPHRAYWSSTGVLVATLTVSEWCYRLHSNISAVSVECNSIDVSDRMCLETRLLHNSTWWWHCSWQSCSNQVQTWTGVRFSSMWTLDSDWNDFGLDAGSRLGNLDLWCLIIWTSLLSSHQHVNNVTTVCILVESWLDWLIDWARLNVPPTQYRSYRGRVFTGQMTQPTVSKHWRNT